MKIYADNAATTPMSPAAIHAMTECMNSIYGNPSSLHSFGQAASAKLISARRTMAEVLRCRPDEIIFTSGGSEADNQALRAAAWHGQKQNKRRLITTAIEHHAILEPLAQLEQEGFETVILPVESDGRVLPETVANAITEDTALVSVMYVNNETGAVQPVEKIGQICRERGVLFHTDAVQAVGHLPIDLSVLPVDLLSLSAHKFHGPKGVGALFVRKNALPVRALIAGGQQERGMRAGTENVPGIVSMAAALGECVSSLEKDTENLIRHSRAMISDMLKIPGCCLNGSLEHRLPGTISVCFENINARALVMLLDMAGLAVSSGSACSAGSSAPSHVLLAQGRSEVLAAGGLRISLDAAVTQAETEEIVRRITAAVAQLRG